MAESIESSRQEAHVAALLRFQSDLGGLDYDIETALSDVWSHLEAQGSAPAGVPFAIFHHVDVDTPIPAPAPWDISAGFPIEGELRGNARLRIERFPACAGVRVMHAGDYSGLGDSMRLLQAWIEAMDQKTLGPPRLIFHTDPAAVLDKRDWRTEIFWPLRR